MKSRCGHDTVIIFRLGSLGDTLVALPCFHLIEQTFPEARRVVLTNFPISAKAAALGEVLGASGLIDDTLAYSVGERVWSELADLRRLIRDTGAATLVYLTARSSLIQVLRDVAFFRACGIKRVIGAPFSSEKRESSISELGFVEPEAERLARCISSMGEINLNDRRFWDLRIGSDEHSVAEAVVAPFHGAPFLAVSPGGKQEIKDWGDDNWRGALQSISSGCPGLSLVFVGSGDERERFDHLASFWSGPVVNTCGQLSPRQSAALLQRSVAFLGHDSGPMHLAAAMGIRCVGLFGNNNLPGKWHPYGAGHRILHDMAGIRSISVRSVIKETNELLLENSVFAESFLQNN